MSCIWCRRGTNKQSQVFQFIVKLRFLMDEDRAVGVCVSVCERACVSSLLSHRCNNGFNRETGSFNAPQACLAHSTAKALISRDASKTREKLFQKDNCWGKITYLLSTFFWAALPAPLCRRTSEARPRGRRQNRCSAGKLISYNASKNQKESQQKIIRRWASAQNIRFTVGNVAWFKLSGYVVKSAK